MTDYNELNEDIKFALKAQLTKVLAAKKRDLLKSLSPQEKVDLYYDIYERLDKERIRGQQAILRPGLSKIAFKMKSIRISEMGSQGFFDTNIVDLIGRICECYESSIGKLISDQVIGDAEKRMKEKEKSNGGIATTTA